MANTDKTSPSSPMRPIALVGMLLLGGAAIWGLRARIKAPPPPLTTPTNATTNSPAKPTPNLPTQWVNDPMRTLSGGVPPPANIGPLRQQLNPSIALRPRFLQSPNDISLRIQYAVSLDNEGNASEAEDVLREALQKGQKKPEVYHALGMLYLKNNLYYGAVEEFLAEIKLAPKSANAHLNLAQAYTYLNQSDSATKAFEKTKELDPTIPDTYLGLALLNNTSERYQFAEQYLLEYIKRTPTPGPGYALLCRVYINMRLNDKAIEAGKKASEAMPTDPGCWYNLGQAYSFHPSGKFDAEAAKAFEQGIQLNPNWGGLHFELGRVYERLNRREEAVARYRDAVRLIPSNGKSRYQLGRLLMQMGQAAEGQKEVEKSQTLIRLNQRETQLIAKIAAAPKEAKLVLELGEVYRDQGEYQKALNTLGFLVKMAPNHPKAQETLEQVKRLAGAGR